MEKLQITTHYADGRQSETRDMTDEEVAEIFTDSSNLGEGTDETPSAD
jgi:hypothetical protein